MKICPNCNKKYVDTIKYCQTCHWYLGNTESISEKEYYKNIKQDTKPSTPTVTCPYCQSTDTKKITNTSKAVHTALFGVFSMSRNAKEWHCNNCNSDF